MKLWKIFVVLAVLLLIGLFTAHHFVSQRVVNTLLSENLGADVEIGEIDADLRNSRVSLKDLRIRNPEGFPGDTALDVRQLDVTYQLTSLFTRTTRLTEVVLDVKQVVLVTNEEGEQNLQVLTRKGRSPRTAPDTSGEVASTPSAEPGLQGEVAERAGKPEKAPKPRRQTHIDRLVFRLGEVEMRDYSRGTPEPIVRTYRLNMERTFTDVQDFDAVAQAVGADLAFAMGPQLIRDMLEDSGVRSRDIVETIETHDGDLDELGRKLDEQTKDLQRELRRQMRALREREE